MIAVSLVVPVYNKEKYVAQCIKSLCSQTLSDIEIICIDDGSLDKSLEIITRLSKLDKRIRVIRHDKNMGTLQARKHGVECAAGRYVMFIDSDDWLEAEACSVLSSMMDQKQLDILQFGTNLIPGETVSNDMCNWVENFLKPCEQRITGREIIKSCFLEDRFDFNITDKIWNAQLCKKAFSEIQDVEMVAAEDQYTFFVLAYYAESYEGIANKYYNYNLGIGITGGDQLDIERFEKRCSGARASKYVKEFLDSENAYLNYADEHRKFENKILWDCIDCWYNKLDEKDQGTGYDMLSQYWSADKILGAIARVYFEQEEDVRKRLQKSEIVSESRNIGIYHRYLGYEPTAEFIQWQVNSAEKAGYHVTLFSDEDILGENTKKWENKLVLLPPSKTANWDGYAKRAQAFQHEVKSSAISCMLYTSPASHIAWLDMLLLRTLKIAVIPLDGESERLKWENQNQLLLESK